VKCQCHNLAAQQETITSYSLLFGVTHYKDDFGFCGWTVPKTPKLDHERWLALIAQDEADWAMALQRLALSLLFGLVLQQLSQGTAH
jgi:hypothetical protein